MVGCNGDAESDLIVAMVIIKKLAISGAMYIWRAADLFVSCKRLIHGSMAQYQ